MGLFDRIQKKENKKFEDNTIEKFEPRPNSTNSTNNRIKISEKNTSRLNKLNPIDDLKSSLLDKYLINIDKLDFNVSIEKKEGIKKYNISNINYINSALSKLTPEMLKELKTELSDSELNSIGQIQGYLKNYFLKNNIKIKDIEIHYISQYFYLIIGKLGLIEILINDPELEEIMINGVDIPVYIFHRKYQMCKTNIILDKSELARVIDSIAYLAGRSIDSRIPMLDAYLPDGSRVNATTPDITTMGNTLTIRKFSKNPLTIINLIKYNTIDSELGAFIWQAVEGYFGAKPANTLIVGGTGSGKTTTLNVVSMFSMYNDRLITIEDTPELQIPLDHTIKMITRPGRPGIDNYEITMDDLIKNSLRMRPDRIYVGEVRGSEAHSLLVAMNTGHDGCSGTLHANSADEAMIRLINPPMNVPKIMLSSINFIINQQRIKRNKKTVRRILGVVEVGGQGDEITKTELYKYNGATDGIEKVGICMWEDEVCKITGITRDELLADRVDRKRVLDYMANNDISDIKKVSEIVRKYQENPESILKMI
ncbi:type II/IV secretion system ATPase subunit [Methanococcus voltae]|jgi:flagellar protein FlaI|uniref:Flagellar protein FlaI n=2 Tax=Methanococcus voltae TaxID=2188 RepID=A0A8J7URT3_METVO|nr:ATPase, T2SS/T4P/T4SS family [Methanococcus voltae]MBP2173244.1 flagellar protein FlaI [Methanococcus voltae]MBP2202108.1 flagellar protein FlaI [Methanococcus voltae]MCS3922921.1 flagellar protein FlaI [Methanococcus voltae PS]